MRLLEVFWIISSLRIYLLQAITSHKAGGWGGEMCRHFPDRVMDNKHEEDWKLTGNEETFFNLLLRERNVC